MPSGILSSRVKPGSLVIMTSLFSLMEMMTSMTCWRRSTRLTALLRKLATLSLADAMRTPSSAAIIDGAMTAVTSATIVTTTTISTRVTPAVGLRPLLRFPTDNVRIQSIAARLTVGAETHDLGLLAVLAGEPVKVIVAPGILGNVHLHVRTVPLTHVIRPDTQRQQALLGSRK